MYKQVIAIRSALTYFLMNRFFHSIYIYLLLSLSFLSFVSQENVGGGGCDECKSGTFGLWRQNPAGCSPCFCFGVSSICEELGGLLRVPVSTLSFSDSTIPKMHHMKSTLLIFFMSQCYILNMKSIELEQSHTV